MEDQIYESLTAGVRRQKHKKGIFICGAAGAGKSTTRDTFLKDAGIKTTFVLLNIDNIRPIVGSHEKAVEVLKKIMDRTISDGYSFVYDGTCRNKGEIFKYMDFIKRNGYEIIIGIVYAPLNIALQRIEQRTNQPLDIKIAKEIYEHVQNSVEKFMKSNLPDEVYLYNNTENIKLIFHRKHKKIFCNLPNSKFYFDVSNLC